MKDLYTEISYVIDFWPMQYIRKVDRHRAQYYHVCLVHKGQLSIYYVHQTSRNFQSEIMTSKNVFLKRQPLSKQVEIWLIQGDIRQDSLQMKRWRVEKLHRFK